MGRHAKSFNVIGDAVADYLTLLLLAVRFVADLVSSVAPKPRREVRWPTGADEEWAEWLHRANETPVMREEVRV